MSARISLESDVSAFRTVAGLSEVVASRSRYVSARFMAADVLSNHGEHSIVMKEIGDLVCGFAPRLLVVPISRKALDLRLSNTCLKEVHERRHVFEILVDSQGPLSRFSHQRHKGSEFCHSW
jgi:hypothetical protein